MPSLSEDQKRRIVQGLACFRTPSEVSEDVEEEFGVKIDRSHVRKYNPEQVSDVAEKWRVLFAETRKRFVEEVAEIPITHQSFRLRELLDLYRKAKRNPVLAASLLEQAAKEVGGAFTNRREHSGPGGGPIATRDATVDLTKLSTETLRKVREELGE